MGCITVPLQINLFDMMLGKLSAGVNGISIFSGGVPFHIGEQKKAKALESLKNYFRLSYRVSMA